jgi:hypothetical protein
MNNNPNNFEKDEIFRLYEQSEMSDIINDESYVHKGLQKLRSVKNKFPVLYTLLSAGTLAGAVSIITLLRRYRLF